MRRPAVVLAAFIAMWLLVVPAKARNQVPEMEIDAKLFEDGSAVITQTLRARTDEGTEFYLALNDSGCLRFSGFSVRDGSGEYAYKEGWDIDAGLEEKAGQYGVLETEGGVELCWGIGRYGEESYTVSYTIEGLAGAYSDRDGFNYRFVDGMSTFPTEVSLTISCETPLTDEACDIWAFGYNGDIWFENGAVRARTSSPLDGGQHMTVMLSLEKGLLYPERRAGGSFEAVKEEAFSGSSYKGSGFGDFLLGLLIILLAGAAVVVGAALMSLLRRARLRRRMKRAEYFRDAPNGGNMNVTHRIGAACGLCREDSLIGAYLLRLISGGSLEPLWSGNRVAMKLLGEPEGLGPFGRDLYRVLLQAAGPDGLLQAAELEDFCQREGNALYSFVESCQKDADTALIKGGAIRGAVCLGTKSLTKQGHRELEEILGLKRFLMDFSLIHERGVKETLLWQDYMVYAHLLGIAEVTAREIRKLYPEALPEVDRFRQYIGYSGSYNAILYSAYERQRQTARSSGSGGRASLGGGGGFTGGGGGGTR